jgi:hypothetical protein
MRAISNYSYRNNIGKFPARWKFERRKELGLLGLSEKEQAALSGRMTAAADVSADLAAAERARALAGSGAAMGGQALQEAVLMDAARSAQKERIGQTLLEADLQREREEEDRIAALRGVEAEARAQRLSAAGAIAGAGLEAGLTTAAQQKIIQGSRSPSPQLIAQTKQTFGFTTDDEARGFIELQYSDPQAAQLVVDMQRERIKAGSIR